MKPDDPEAADPVFGRDMRAQGWAHAGIKTAGVAPTGDFAITRQAGVCLKLSRPRSLAGWSRLLLHEIGHVIGLTHPGRFGPTMACSETNIATALHSGVRAGAALLYNPPPVILRPSGTSDPLARPTQRCLITR